MKINLIYSGVGHSLSTGKPNKLFHVSYLHNAVINLKEVGKDSCAQLEVMEFSKRGASDSKISSKKFKILCNCSSLRGPQPQASLFLFS